MPLRRIRLPADISAVAALALRAFQYPENEAWSVQSDEKKETIDAVSRLRRLWPLIWLIQLVSPALRDIFHGYVWQEDDQLVGMVNFQRLGTTDAWYINAVAVLPGYRRRGIGRKLVQATLDFVRECGSKVALLDVIAGNVPAYALYERLGFEHFTSGVTFDYTAGELSCEQLLPDGYTVSSLDFFDWRPDFRLARRITPVDVQRYEPVEEARFRRPRSMHLLMRIIRGLRQEKIAIRTASGGQIVALGEYAARLRPGGVNRIDIRMDPAHVELAPYLVQRLIRTTQRLSPGRRIEFGVPQWQDVVVEAAHATGCVKRLEYRKMGVSL